MGAPQVKIQEIDLTNSVVGDSTSISAYAGRFYWGPLEQEVLVSDETALGAVFGKPKAKFASTNLEADSVAVSFMHIASYLAYSQGARISRVANTNDAVAINNAINAVSTLTVGDVATPILIKNVDDYKAKEDLGNLGASFVIAKYAGAMGNSIGVSAVFTSNQFASGEILNAEVFTLNKADSGKKTLGISTSSTQDLRDSFSVGDYVTFTYNTVEYTNIVTDVAEFKLTLQDVGAQMPTFPSASATGTVTAIKKAWKFNKLFTGAPSAGEFHLVVYDTDGAITGEAGTVLNKYAFLTNQFDSVTPDGNPSYYKTVINNQSEWIWVGGANISTQFTSLSVLAYNEALTGGRNGTTPNVDDYINAHDVFTDTELDIDFIICPPLMDSISNATLPNYLIQNIAEVRKDLVVYISPRKSDVVNAPKQEIKNIKSFRSELTATSYGFLDSGWKLMYDRYNNVDRWVPLCGDTAGTAARTDYERNPWWSHAGYNRGIIKNIIRLAWNPSAQISRDELYQVDVNSVFKTSGNGTVLFGDKTLLGKDSAFSRINVRRLFIALKKPIAKASKFMLFEFNDEITRSRFISIVEPYLREVKSLRGVTDYLIVCDTSNNTSQVIEENRFIGDIYVKANRSINEVGLRFINTPVGIEFQEIVGKF